MGQQWPAAGFRALSAAVPAWEILKEVTIIFITSTTVWPQVKQGGNTAPPINRKLKIYGAWPRPPEQDPVSPSVSLSLPSGSFHKPLIFLRQRPDKMKTTIAEN